MTLDILWLLVLHWGLTEMAISVPLCSTFLPMERFCCVSGPFPSPFLLRGCFVWHQKEEYTVSGNQESLKDLEKW